MAKGIIELEYVFFDIFGQVNFQPIYQWQGLEEMKRKDWINFNTISHRNHEFPGLFEIVDIYMAWFGNLLALRSLFTYLISLTTREAEPVMSIMSWDWPSRAVRGRFLTTTLILGGSAIACNSILIQKLQILSWQKI